MRNLIPPGLLLLALALLLNVQAGVYDGVLPELGGSVDGDAGRSVRIFSQGKGCTAENFDRRRQPQAIIVDGKIRTHRLGEYGLRVSSFRLDGDEPAFENFDLETSDEAAAAFAAHVREAPLDTVLAMGVYGSIAPDRDEGAPERAAMLERVFAELGAESRPAQHRNTSWAYLCVRRAEGWLPLAESFSPTKGVMLAHHLPADLDRLDRRLRAEALVDRRVRARLTRLYSTGTTLLGPFARARRGYGSAFVVNKVQRDGLFATPPHGAKAAELDSLETKLSFFVRLGADPVFETQLGMLSYHRPVSKGCEFEVAVQGEVAGTRAIAVEPNEPDAWLPWTVDLSRWAHRWVKIELRTRRLGLAPGEVPQWAEPLVWGDPAVVSTAPAPEAAPELGEWELFLTLLDKNMDWLLAPAEPPGRILALDVDGDGKVSAAEWPPFATWVAAALDTDRDGAVSAAEAKALYERLFEL